MSPYLLTDSFIPVPYSSGPYLNTSRKLLLPAKFNLHDMELRVQEVAIFNVTLVCHKGTIPGNGKCVKCAPGYYREGLQIHCKPCPVGTYQTLEGSSRCIPCPLTKSTIQMGSKHVTDCRRICPPGTYSLRKNNVGLAVAPCRPCNLKGDYSDEPDCVGCDSLVSSGAAVQNCGIHRNACSSSPCRNNSTCIHEPFECLCREGFLGSFCEQSFNPCDSSPCLNGGACSAVTSLLYICHCSEGYLGYQCQQEKNYCASSPCLNSGECHSILNGYVCECKPGFHGENCSNNLDTCSLVQPCSNNGTCISNNSEKFQCECQDFFSGKYCDVYEGCLDEEKWFCESNATKTEDCPNCHLRSRDCTTDKTCGNINEVDENVLLSFSKSKLTEYLLVDIDVADISEISCCLWVITADQFNFGTPFSYATSESDNTFSLTDYNGFVLYVLGERVVTDITANDNHWHYICVTWSSDGGSWRIYLDGAEAAAGADLNSGHRLRGKGKMVIGQDQDFVGGGFNKAESFIGNMTQVNMWDVVLTPEEIKTMTESCNSSEIRGNVVSWTTFLQNSHGNISVMPFKFCSQCGPAPRMFRAEVISMEDYASYKCEPGFHMRSSGNLFTSSEQEWKRKCLKTGEWEPSSVHCIRISCGLPGPLTHGSVQGRSFLFEDVVHYRCHHGFRLIGPTIRTCNANSKWSGIKPICRGNINCKAPTAPRRGAMFFLPKTSNSYGNSSVPGDQVEFMCDGGYYLRGASILTCMQHGHWDHTEPMCSLCPDPQPSEKIQWKNLIGSDSIEIICVTTGEKKINSCINGMWDTPIDFCHNREPCPPAEPPPHGFLIVKYRPLPQMYTGDIVNFGCRHGYSLRNSNVIQCSDDKKWNASDSSCEKVRCPHLQQPLNTYSLDTSTDLKYGDTIKFYCLPGFKSIGNLSVRCEANGQWSDLQETCHRISCGRPAGNHTFEGTSFFYGDTLIIHCSNGKRENVTCQASSEWTRPSCY